MYSHTTLFPPSCELHCHVSSPHIPFVVQKYVLNYIRKNNLFFYNYCSFKCPLFIAVSLPHIQYTLPTNVVPHSLSYDDTFVAPPRAPLLYQSRPVIFSSFLTVENCIFQIFLYETRVGFGISLIQWKRKKTPSFTKCSFFWRRNKCL